MFMRLGALMRILSAARRADNLGRPRGEFPLSVDSLLTREIPDDSEKTSHK